MTRSPDSVACGGSKGRFKRSPELGAQCGVSERLELWPGWNLWRPSEIAGKHFRPVSLWRMRTPTKKPKRSPFSRSRDQSERSADEEIKT
jgi:hypothetical protein